jgi:outer membrane protein assembly factor BamD (BamD/ComL family)
MNKHPFLAILATLVFAIFIMSGFAQTPNKAEREAWQKAKSLNTFEAAVAFVKEYPNSQFAKEARSVFGRSGRKPYDPQITAVLSLENGEPYAIVEVFGERMSQRASKNKNVPIEEALTMLQTKEEREMWYEIVASDRVDKGVRVITSNLRVYLIYGLSFNFTGHIKPL